MNPKIVFGFVGLGASEILIIFFVLLLCFVPAILYLLMLQRTLTLVSPDLRRMPPGQVWLMLIPVFGIIWHFIMVRNIADSLAAELHKRNLPYEEERPGYKVGLAMCILGVVSLIPIIGSIASIAALVLFIIYWVKIAGYKRQLEQANFFQPPAQMPPYQGPHSPYQS